MRYEDASGSFSQAAAGTTDARNDEDALAAGSKGPATGNTITGAGTITGEAGADLVANAPGQIVALEGAGGSDSGDGGSLHVEGRFGELTMNASGSYSYEPNAEVPNGGRDVFRYTLADAAGERDTATLTIDIGRELEKIDANAQQIIPGPDGVVTLPPGVQLSDVHVVGRNLVINMPDGTQMIIIDGAVFVPQLVLNGVEVPASNLAALLIEAEPRPAGGIPQSSGGNFEVPVPPLDPGVPLGDLIPPTELAFEPPIFEDIGQFIDQEPEILIQPDNQPASVAAVDSVNEAGLPTRNEGEPAGSGESADGNGADNDDPSEATTGVILIDSPDDPSVVTINGFVVTGVIGQVIPGLHGTLTITSVSDTAIGYLYTLTDNTTGDATHDDFIVTVTDNDGDQATATLTINIVDDVPTARPDTDSIAAGEFGPATGNVITDAAAGDIGDSDTNAADTVGADNASVTSVSGFGGSDSTFSEGALVVDGQYGVLTIEADGDYSYVRNPNTPGGVTDVFNYTLTDGDGDTSTSTLTINIADLPVTVGENEVVRTDDDAVPGANGNPGGIGDDVDAENLVGTLSGSGGDGTLTFAVQTTGAPAGFTYVSGGAGIVLVQQGGITVLTVTVAANGDYSVVQNAPIDHAALGDENNTSFTINYRVTDLDGDFDDGTLTIDVDDDTPTISREDVSAPTLTVDETDLATNATGDFSTLFDVSYGADGAGTTSYGVSVVDGTDSGLDDVATGQDILLFNNGGVVEGRVGGVGGVVAFTVSINSTTGVVTLDQIRALEHPDASDPDDPVSPNATSIQLTATAVDGDGDPVTLTINIGGNFVFDDDGPSVTATLLTGTVDEDGVPGGIAGGTGDVAGESTVATGSVATLFSSGADAPLTYSLLANTAGLPALTSAGVPVTYAVVGNTLTASAGGNTVFTFVLNADGTYTFTLVDQLDHAAGNNENDLTIQLGSIIQATDADGDSVTANANGLTITVDDDTPTASATLLTGTVDEDGVPGGIAGGIGDVPGTATVANGSVATLFNSGADAPLTYSLLANTSGLPALTSAGVPVTYAVVGNTLTASAGANTVFTFVLNADGTYTFTLVDQLDHAPGDNENDLTIQLGSIIQATDADGDSVTANANGLTITVDDDTPQNNSNTLTFLADEDALPGGNPGGPEDGPGSIAGPITSSIALLFSSGADAPLTISMLTDTSGLPALTSGGVPVTYAVVGNTLTASAGANTVFTIVLNPATGEATFTLLDQLDHPTLNGEAGDNTENNLILDVSSIFQGTDADGDSVTLDAGSFQINIDDDTPTASGSQVTGTVDEDGVPGGIAGGTGDVAGENTIANGSVTTLFSAGADAPLSYSLLTNTAGLPALTSNSVAVTYAVVGNTLTASAGANTVFTFVLNANGTWTFTLVDQLDHPTLNGLAGDNTENDLTINLSSLIQATDADGDSVVAGANGLIITVDDDTPVARNDTDAVLAGGDTTTGNVITGVGTTSGAAGIDSPGADAPAAITGLASNNVPANEDNNPAGGFVVTGQYGVLTMQADGGYLYDRNDGAPGDVQDVFTYSYTDADGDTVTATLTINIGDAAPNLPDPALVRLDDDVIPGANGNPDGPGDDDPDTVPGNVVAGTLVGSGGDGALTYNFTGLNTLPAGFSVGAGSDADTLLINQGATLVMTIQLNQATGAFTVTQNAPMLHPADNGGPDDNIENNLLFSIGVEVEDSDGDVEPATITINVDDDTPTINVTKGADAGVVLTTDDADTIGVATDTASSTANFSGVFGLTQSAGADGTAAPATLSYALDVTGFTGGPAGVDSGLNQGGNNIYLYEIGGKVVGSTSATLAGVAAGNTVFDVGVNGTGVVTLTQYSQIDHVGGDPTPTGGPPFADHIVSIADGLVTLTASASLTDNDGDTVTDSEVVNIGANLRFTDDGPDAQTSGTAIGTVTLDETRPEGTDTPGGVAPTGDASATIDFSANFVSGGSVDYGADGPGSVVYALLLSGANVASGLYALDPTDISIADLDGYGQGASIVLNQVGNVITGSAGGTDYFTITINPATGIVTFAQLNPIWHPTAPNNFDETATLTTAAASNIQVVQTVTDFDGDTDTASINVGQGVFQIQDDGPQAIQPDAITEGLNNEVGASATADLDDDGEVITDFGEDGPGLVTFANITENVPTGLTSDGDAIEYFLKDDGQTLEGRTNSTNGIDGELVFTVAINQGDGTYTVTMSGTIDNGAGVTFSNLTSTKAGNVDVRGVGADDPLTTVDLLLTASGPGGVNTTINTSSTTVGSANQSMNEGETIRIDFVSNLEDDPADDLGTFPSGFSYDGHVGTNSFLQFIPQVQADQSQTVAFQVYALNTTVTDAGSPDDYPGDGFSDSSIVAITKVTVDGFDVGETPVTVNIGAIGVWTTIAYGVSAQLQADGSVIFSGIQEGDQYGIETGTDFNAIAISSLAAGIGPVGNLSSTNAFDLGVFSIGQVDSGDPIQLTYDLNITDADGDTVTMVGAIDITIDPAGTPAPLALAVVSQESIEDVSAFSLMASDSTDQYRTMSYANNNSVLLGAIAAAGLGAGSQAAAHNFAPGGHEMLIDTSAFGYVGGDMQGFAIDNSDMVRSALGAETMEVVGFDSFVESSSHRSAITEQLSLTDGAGDATPAPTALLQGTEAIGMELAQSTLTSAAVGMPSAEMLVAGGDGLSVAGAPQTNGEVGRVLFDALAGGGGANIDAVLDAVTNSAGGGNAGLQAIASHVGGDVSPWHMADFAGYSAGHSANMMETMALQPDAVHTAA